MTGGQACGGLRRVALAVEAGHLPQMESGTARNKQERIPTSHRACHFSVLLSMMT